MPEIADSANLLGSYPQGLFNRMFKKLIWIFATLSVVGLLGGAVLAFWGYNYITRDLPSFEAIEEYAPPSVSKVFAADGSLVAEFFKERRYPAKLEEIPVFARNCFLAAEDASFYSHSGINPLSILRAFLKNLQAGSSKQGASTITQQVVKNLLLSPEKKLERKIKEAILSYRLEQVLTKDQILELYLNQIYFGNTAYGIKAATRAYFHKELSEITLAEAAMLAGLPQAPSRYSPIAHFSRAKKRQQYVLSRMVETGFLTQAEADQAEREEVHVYAASPDNIYAAPFYAAEVRRVFAERWQDHDIDTEGLSIYTALDRQATTFAEQALQHGLQDTDKRRGWRGPIAHLEKPESDDFTLQIPYTLVGDPVPGVIYPALVRELKPGGQVVASLGAQEVQISLTDSSWAKKFLDKDDKVSWGKPEEKIHPGDVIEVSLQLSGPAKTQSVKWKLDQTPAIEGAAMLLNPHSGEVAAVVGGYSYQRSQFNRATQGMRQPGSAFKPIVYLAAIDGYRYTPATIVYDQPHTFRVGEDVWSPGNFDENFLGPITLRTALEKSRNLVSADIVSGIGVDAVIEYARKMGITAKLGRNLSLSLGSSELSMEELARAYGVFPAKGVLFPTVYVTKIVNRKGEVIYDYQQEKLQVAKQVISENSAFIMAHMMKGVVENGTAMKIKEIGRPVAGKTGTSNDQMDAWFIGYTPEWVAAIWVGFDQKKDLGDKETGGKVAVPIWLDFMRAFLDDRDKRQQESLNAETKAEAERLGIHYQAPPPPEPADFSVPEGVDPFWVDKKSGLLAERGAPGAILEYFLRGTEPNHSAVNESANGYLNSPEL